MDKDIKQSKPVISVIIPIYNNAAYLEKTLNSLRCQTYGEFEAILVDDGSTDASGKIIDEFVHSDRRFRAIRQEHSGVSVARNVALDLATGAYVTFVDGDDTLPEDAIQNMAKVAQAHHPDLLIGGIRRIDGFSEKINQRTRNLKYKQEIRKDDLDLVHGLSLCNKWFRRDIIVRHGVHLEPFRHLEDGVFLYAFLQYAEKIQYCDAIVYNYWKRIPLNGGSVTQRVEEGLLEDAIRAFERLQELTKSYSEDFRQELVYRINSTTLIGDYYRKIWFLDPQTERRLISYTGRILLEQSEAYRKRTIASHPGLQLERGLQTKEALQAAPLFTIFISQKISQTQINLILRSIYGQAIVAFQIVMDEKYEDCIEDSLKQKKNLCFSNLGASPGGWLENVKQASGRYVIFLDADVIFDHDTLLTAFQQFRKRNCHVVKIPVISSEKLTGMTGLVFERHYLCSQPQKLRAGVKACRQRSAPLICIRDLERREEMMRPTKTEQIKMKIKEFIKLIYHWFSHMVHRS